jgi:Polysaccharide lyase
MKRSALLATLVLALASGGWGCSPRVDVGSSLRWFAQHETGDFSEWTAGYKGGCSADPPDTSVVISTDVAHSGTHSVKLANAAPSVYETARLWRQDDYPQEAYYSAWFYLPQAYRTTEDWTIMQFQVPPSGDAGTNGLLVDVDLRSLPGGEMILDVFDHRGQYLRSPTAEPALPVPIAAWFQIEVFYRNVGDDTGRFTLWLDGQVNYDIHRPFGLSSVTYWSPCSSSEGLSPTQSDLYVDDAAVSLVRVGPTGAL